MRNIFKAGTEDFSGITDGELTELAARYRELGLAACLAHAEAILADRR